MALSPAYRPLTPTKLDELPEILRRELHLAPQGRKPPKKNRSLNFAIFILATGVAIAWHLNRPLVTRPNVYLPSTREDLSLADLHSPDLNTIVHTVRAGESLETIISRYALEDNDVPALHSAIRSLDSGVTLQRGKRVAISTGTNGRVQNLRFDTNTARQVIINRTDPTFTARLVDPPRVDVERIAEGTITSSFFAAARQDGVSFEAIDDLVDLFSDRIEFNRDFRVGDRFALIYSDAHGVDGATIGKAKILAAALSVNGELFTATRFVGTDGKVRYFDEKGRALGNTFLRYPLQFSRISSYFSDARFHPVLRIRRPHNGIDFAAPVGTPVRSVADGKIVFAGYKGPNGNMVLVQHNDRYSTAYLHLAKIGAGISRGKRVSKGQSIGTVGMTGLSTGPHLHFSLYDRGKYVDPLKTKLDFAETEANTSPALKRYLRRAYHTLRSYCVG